MPGLIFVLQLTGRTSSSTKCAQLIETLVISSTFSTSELREHGTLDADQVVDTPWLRLVEQQKNQIAQV
jgi:hypothetical protein